MAVKQKVVECVTPTNEARLQLILRALQAISPDDGFQDKFCAQIVKSLGTVPIPTDPLSYMKFIEDIKKVENILSKECSDKRHIYKALLDEISNLDSHRQLSPAMSIVLQLIDVSTIPNAIKYILNCNYPEQQLEKAFYTLCIWLRQCTWVDNLGPLVLAFMKGLEAEYHYDILTEVTLVTIEPLFKLLMFPKIRKTVGPVVLYMLSRNQHNNPQIFHKVIPLTETVCEKLDKERSDSSLQCLKEIVNIFMSLMETFPGYPDLYRSLNEVLQPFCATIDYKKPLQFKPWSGYTPQTVDNMIPVEKVGLNNLGNTCYMNSVLQALFMTKIFRNEVLRHNRDVSQLFSKLQALFVLLQFSKRNSLSPNDILHVSRPPGFSLGHQHDSSEFLGYLLDTLHEQEKNVTNTIESCYGDEGAVALLPTKVQQSFGGKTMTVSRCGECTTTSERVDHFRELQLSFPNHSDNQSVQTLLDYYLQPEKLSGDNQYHCDICNRLTDGEKVTKIVEAPARLIFTLKHFRYDPTSHQRTKLLQTVVLDDRLTLDSHIYELYAAVVHCGFSVDSGHYYTLAKDKSQWYKFNDSCVSKATTEDLKRLKPPETAYILFYSRQDVDEPENISSTILSNKLQIILAKDQSESETEKRQQSNRSFNFKQNRNDEPPPPSCGGGGFSTSGNMLVC
ncbi:ubiquitin carboxyl-terminal hydrolase 38 [Diorhabda carinulata]|uniref:ubiquitin carboxyl-terminal hydrolase 38 n=1 Tax=Diorhabda carinulata TaxID=1163345 RepID=UPI0025A0468C|nr:ubiquitin carboxyl-terminal hydrolase 38 [Diorhabda carinulata]XP_057656004.1 ubiquitin carboxyl-terminal hydrolase 38 [Diorhabda carinulata]